MDEIDASLLVLEPVATVGLVLTSLFLSNLLQKQLWIVCCALRSCFWWSPTSMGTKDGKQANKISHCLFSFGLGNLLTNFLAYTAWAWTESCWVTVPTFQYGGELERHTRIADWPPGNLKDDAFVLSPLHKRPCTMSTWLFCFCGKSGIV